MKNRISYIDMAKGFCMLLVVMIHTGVPEFIPHLYTVKVPLFFILSGFFFSEKLPIGAFLTKKVNTILVPFILWYIVSYSIFYIGICIYPAITNMTEAKGVLDCFTQKNYFNGPLWFLLSLFEVQLLVYIIAKYSKRKILRYLWYLILCIIGFILSKRQMDLPLNIDTAFTSVLFFVTGKELRDLNFFERVNKTNGIIAAIILYLVCLLFPISVVMSVNRYNANFIELYGVCASLSISIILLCKIIPSKEYLLSFIGRHSLFILCSHHLIYRPVKLVLNHVHCLNELSISLLTFVFTMLLCVALANRFEKYLPWFVGKRK